MLIIPGALPVAPIPEQAFAVPAAPSPVKTVAPATQSDKARNDTGQQAGKQQSGNQAGAILAPIPNPDEPTGPTPAFEANLLEVEREKLRAGPPLEKTDGPDKDHGVTPDQIEGKPKTAPEQYAKAPSVETHEVDLTV